MINPKKRNTYKRVDLKLGFLCNNFCLHCVQGNRRVTFGSKSFKQLKKEIKKAAQDCNDVVFTGGEPTIHKDFLKMVGLAKELGFSNIQIQSNGRMFAYRTFCIETIKAGANDFALAVHGHTGKIHDYLSSAEGSFQQTVQGIKNLKSLNMRIATNTVISKINYRHLPQIAELLVKLGVDQFQFAFPHPAGRAKDNFSIIVPRMRKIMPFVKRGLSRGIKVGVRVMTEAIPYCLMRGYEDYVAEKMIPDTRIFDAGYEVDDYGEYRRKQAKLKGPKCNLCKYYSICEGPWREYPEYFGWEEFIPVKI